MIIRIAALALMFGVGWMLGDMTGYERGWAEAWRKAQKKNPDGR